MKLKAGAKLDGVQWRMFDAAIKAEAVFQQAGADLVITSGSDGKHKPTSLHYKGLALDFRTRDLRPPSAVINVAHRLRAALGADFDVVVEGDHIHLEYDPK